MLTIIYIYINITRINTCADCSLDGFLIVDSYHYFGCRDEPFSIISVLAIINEDKIFGLVTIDPRKLTPFN